MGGEEIRKNEKENRGCYIQNGRSYMEYMRKIYGLFWRKKTSSQTIDIASCIGIGYIGDHYLYYKENPMRDKMSVAMMEARTETIIGYEESRKEK